MIDMAIFSVHCTVETGLVQYDTFYAAHLICNSKFKFFQKLYLISSYIFKYDQNIQSIHNNKRLKNCSWNLMAKIINLQLQYFFGLHSGVKACVNSYTCWLTPQSLWIKPESILHCTVPGPTEPRETVGSHLLAATWTLFQSRGQIMTTI